MIGILPAAGSATRMHGIPKMLLPIPGGTLYATLHRRMMDASVSAIHVGTSRLLRNVLAAQRLPNVRLFRVDTETMSETVILSLPSDNEPVLFGMPDSYFDDDLAFLKLKTAMDAGADVAVGLFAVRPGQHRKLGMVHVVNGEIVAFVDKPEFCDWPHAWGILAWRGTFEKHLRLHDPHVGYALPRALDAGLRVMPVVMDGGYYDCGTFDEYFECLKHLKGE